VFNDIRITRYTGAEASKISQTVGRTLSSPFQQQYRV